MNMKKLGLMLAVFLLALSTVFAATQEFDLVEGENTITFTVLPANTSIFSVFSDIEDSIAYIAEVGTSPVKVWDEELADFGVGNDLFVFEFGQEYQIITKKAVSLTVTGNEDPALLAEISVGSTFVEDATRSEPQAEGRKADLDDDRELSYVVFRVPVTVVGEATVTDVTLDTLFTYAPFANEVSSEDIFVIETPLPLTIVNSTKTITVKVLVPSELDSIDSNLDVITYDVDVTVVTEKQSVTQSQSFTVESALTLESLEGESSGTDFECDVEDSESLDCDDEAEELPLNSDIVLKLFVENNWDYDFEDVEFEFDNDNNDIDFDDRSFDQDIDEGEEVEVRVTLEVDNDVDDRDDDTIEIRVIGYDENGAAHGFKYTFDIEFDEDTERVVRDDDRNTNSNSNSGSSNTQSSSNSGSTNTQPQTQPSQPNPNDGNVVVVQSAPAPTSGTGSVVTRSDTNDLLYPISLAVMVVVVLLLIVIVAISIFRK